MTLPLLVPVFLKRIESEIVLVASVINNAAPLFVTVFAINNDFVTFIKPLELYMAPPEPALFSKKVQLSTTKSFARQLIAPPAAEAIFLIKVEL